MAFHNTNGELLGYKPTVFPAGAEVVAVRYAIALTVNDLDAGDVGAVGLLPAACVPVGLVIDTDDLDTHATPTLQASVGLLNAQQSDLAVVFASGLSVGQSAAATPVYSSTLLRLAKADGDRLLGVKWTTGAATKAAGTLGLTLFYKAA